MTDSELFELLEEGKLEYIGDVPFSFTRRRTMYRIPETGEYVVRIQESSLGYDEDFWVDADLSSPDEEYCAMIKVHEAIISTKDLLPEYWQATLEQRLPGGAGSVVEGITTPAELEDRLLHASWSAYTHPDIMPGCKAFYTYDVSGEIGVIDLTKLEPDAMVTLDDRKDTGRVSCTVTGAHGHRETFTVLIVGEEQGRDVVFTFHPGAPVRPSVVQTEPGMHGRTCTVAEAMAMGLTTAKIVR